MSLTIHLPNLSLTFELKIRNVLTEMKQSLEELGSQPASIGLAVQLNTLT